MSNCQLFNLACNEDGSGFAIYQGTSYNDLTLYYKDVDVSSYTPLGQIRNNYFETDGLLLATFTFEPLTFGSVTIGTDTFNATVIKPELSATETALIPSTLPKTPSANFIEGVNGWVYDIKLIGTTETIPLARGFVEVIRDVSRV